MAKKLTRKDVEEKLGGNQVTVSKGVFKVRMGYFYTHGYTAERLVAEVLAAFPNATILDSGNVWRAFRGGASVANQSHWYVRFTIN